MRPNDLRGILQYIPQFRDRIFVICLDGGVVTDDNFANLLLDVAVLRSLNINVILVHGDVEQTKELAVERRLPLSDLDGNGPTDSETLLLSLTSSNRITHEILEGLAVSDLRAACANAIVAHPKGIIDGIDHLWTGKVERIDVDMLRMFLNNGIVPIIPPSGFDGEGKTFRLNADSVAVSIAEAMKACKIIYISVQDGLTQNGKIIRQSSSTKLDALLANKGDIPEEHQSKARCAAQACRLGIPRVHIINGHVDEGLLAEVFSNEGIGTLIYANEYQQIRPARKRDVRIILQLTKESMQNDELIRRNRSYIESNLPDYYLFEIDKNPVACVALRRFTKEKSGELTNLLVSPAHENQGIGRKLIQFIENKAREAKFEKLITLSTQAFAYFQTKAGFSEGTADDLPPARREEYERNGRNSKILVKKLQTGS